jgi:hypothetical protein
MLQVILFCLGEREEARKQAWAARQLFPEDVTAFFTEALVDLFEGKKQTPELRLAPMKGKVTDRQLAELKGVLIVLDALVPLLANFDRPNFQDIQRLFASIRKIKSEGPKQGEKSEVELLALAKVFNLPAIANSWGGMQTVLFDLLLWGKAKSKSATERLAKIAQGCPEGFLLSYCAHARMLYFDHSQDQGRKRQQIHEIAELFDRAARAPFLIKATEWKARQWPVIHTPSMIAVDPALGSRIQPKIDWFLSQGKLSSRDFDWLDNPTRLLGDESLTRKALKTWIALGPKNLDHCERLAQFEVQQGQFVAALREAEKVLAVNPQSATMKKVKADALAGMKRMVEATKP